MYIYSVNCCNIIGTVILDNLLLCPQQASVIIIPIILIFIILIFIILILDN